MEKGSKWKKVPEQVIKNIRHVVKLVEQLGLPLF